VDAALRLAEKYPQLKTLKVALEFVNRGGHDQDDGDEVPGNPEHAKSVLVFVCPSSACWGGDFDLTAKLAEAVTNGGQRLREKMYCLGSHKMASGQGCACGACCAIR